MFDYMILFSRAIGKSAAMRVGTMNADRIVVLSVSWVSDCICAESDYT